MIRRSLFVLTLHACLAFPSSAAAKSCGSISSPALNTGFSSYSVFTYKYSRCSRARSILKTYLRRVGSVRRCSPYGCVKVVGGWKCRTPQVHGTVVGCVPTGAAWSGTNRPFFGISSI